MENKMEIASTMYRALEAQFNSELLNAKSSLLVYFNNAVGIGEHPQHLDQMATAQDKLEILQTHFSKFSEDLNN